MLQERLEACVEPVHLARLQNTLCSPELRCGCADHQGRGQFLSMPVLLLLQRY